MLLIKIKRNGVKVLKGVLLILGLFFLTQCTDVQEDQGQQAASNEHDAVTLTDAQLKNAPIETVQLSEKNIGSILKLNGKIDVPPQGLISVSVPLGGYLKSTELLPGMQVRKGELIAIMEDPQYIQMQQEYLQAKSKLHFAELDYERQSELNQSQASSNKVMQQAEAEMSNQRIILNALTQQLSMINIKPERLSENTIIKNAPLYSQINGFVSKVNVNIGKYVSPSEVLFELIDPSDIHLNLKVYEKDVNKLAIGQKLVAYSNFEPDKKHNGTIILISKDVNNDGISEVHCHFEQYDKNLLPGTYMNAEIETQTTFAYALPEESVVGFEAKEYVFVETEKQSFKMVPVTTGEKENGFIQIINHADLSGMNIVTKNAYTLLMKLKNTGDDE